MPKHELLAAHKEIPGLGNFYQRVVKETNPLERAKIFKNSLVVFKKLPVDQITPSDCEAWLQTAAAIMGVGMEKYNDPDVLMEATAQFGLLDLMTKFHHGGLEGTSQYYKSAENLQRFLTARFSLIKDDTGLKAEAYGIPWASEVLYYDHRVDLNSDLRRHEKWINEALGETLERLNKAKSNFDQETVINGVKANAAMSNKNTSSQEKSAAIMLLSILGCTSPKESQIVLKARASMEPAQLSAMQLKARAAMSDLLRPQLGSSVVGRTDFLIFCHNAQRVQEFQQIFDFPDSLLDPIKFEEVEIFGFRYSRMRNEVLESQIKKDVEITEFSRLIGTSDAEKAEKLPSYMEKLLGPSTDQMRLAKYETWIQTIGQLMEVTKSDPHEALIEEIANAGLLKLMRKFRGAKDPESIKFYESARNLQHVLTLRRLKHEEAIATYSSKENQSDWLSKIFGLEAQ